MGLAAQALALTNLFSAKQALKDQILAAASNGQRQIKSERLNSLPERITDMANWLRAEGFRVEHIKREEKPTGLGASLAEDDDTVTVEYYTISW